jgi:uncharacterized protein (TIGR04255 family)
LNGNGLWLCDDASKRKIKMTTEVFKNAPITEAIFDIRAELPKNITLENLAAIQERIKTEFPKKKNRYFLEGQFQFEALKDPAIVQSSRKIDGHLFLTNDEKMIVQARLDGFTFNKLKPYSDWQDFGSKAKSMWMLYASLIQPEHVTRVSLRYVNRIELPFPFKDFKEYILTVPEVAPGLPQRIEGYFLQLVMPDSEIGATAIINQTIDSQNTSTVAVPIIFDIDVVKNVRLPPENFKQIDGILEQLREFKDRIFFNSLTEKAKELFR